MEITTMREQGSILTSLFHNFRLKKQKKKKEKKRRAEREREENNP